MTASRTLRPQGLVAPAEAASVGVAGNAVQGVNNSDAVRMAFEKVNEKGGVNSRKIRFIVEDSRYRVPRAVQAMNKLLNNDNIFATIDNGGTPANGADMPVRFAKKVPNMFPMTSARSMYEPYNRVNSASLRRTTVGCERRRNTSRRRRDASRFASPTRTRTSARMCLRA